MTPAQERQEGIDAIRGILAGGLVIAAPLLLVIAWLTWGVMSLVGLCVLVIIASVWHGEASKRGEGA